MKKNINIFKYVEKIIIFLLLLFSLIINQHYGNKGIFPLDSFSHFDRGFGILLGEHPFKDYWVISGPVIDYFQSFFNPLKRTSIHLNMPTSLLLWPLPLLCQNVAF